MRFIDLFSGIGGFHRGVGSLVNINRDLFDSESGVKRGNMGLKIKVSNSLSSSNNIWNNASIEANMLQGMGGRQKAIAALNSFFNGNTISQIYGWHSKRIMRLLLF